MKYKIFTVLVWVLIGTNLCLADTLTLPQPKGTYGVGTVNTELADSSRTQFRSSEKRRFMATVFYPTDKSQNTYPYMGFVYIKEREVPQGFSIIHEGLCFAIIL